MKKVLFSIFLIYSFGSLLAQPKRTEQGIKFTYKNPTAEKVYIAGTFNNWNASQYLLIKDEEGIWTITLDLNPGQYQYKFIVDGVWIADPENDATIDDGYGGTNSLLEIDQKGEIAIQKQTGLGVKTRLNPKITFDGNYFATYTAQYDTSMAKKWQMNKPNHNFNLGINTRLNPYFHSRILLNVNNQAEQTEMYKTHLNFRHGFLQMQNNSFTLKMFDNVGVYSTNDPLKFFGNQGRYNYDFGFETQGLNFQYTLPFDISLNLIYANVKNSSTDIGYIELNRKILDSDLSMMSYLSRYSTGQNSYMENLSFAGHNHYPFIEDLISLDIEGTYFINRKIINNKTKTTLLDGYTIYGSASLPKSRRLLSNMKISMLFGAKYNIHNFRNDWGVEVWYDTYKDYHIETITSLAKMDINWHNLAFSLSAEHKDYEMPPYLDWDRFISFQIIQDNNGRTECLFSNLRYNNYTQLGYKNTFTIKPKVKYSLWQFNFALQQEIAKTTLFSKPRYIENILQIIWNFSTKGGSFGYPKWQLYNDIRYAVYNDEYLNVKDSFISYYTEVKLCLFTNLELSIGYGIDPYIYDEYYEDYQYQGRERYLMEYVNESDIYNNYKNLGLKIKDAERKLQDAQQIIMKAKLVF